MQQRKENSRETDKLFVELGIYP